MNRPYIVCHMMTALDGKITGPFMRSKAADIVGEEYERTNETYNPNAWLCGRVTTDENFTFYKKPELYDNSQKVPDGDYVAMNNAKMYYVSIDASGKIGWTNNTLKYANRPEAHIIEVVTKKASNAYLDFLRRKNISYIIAGDDQLDLNLLAQKLKELFYIDRLMVSGGGYINWSFLQEGLIDELSLVIAPVADGESETVTLFEKSSYLPSHSPIEFSLKSVEKLDGDGIWMQYKVLNNK